jgi:hypothetical protein
MNDVRCPLCEGPIGQFRREPGRDMLAAECEVCGRFNISPTAMTMLNDEIRLKLSCVARRASSPQAPLEILSGNLEQLAKSLPKYSPTEKLDNFLQILGTTSPKLGAVSTFFPVRDWPLLALPDPNEISFLVRELGSRGYLEKPAIESNLVLTMRGWERLDEIRRQGRQSTRCFVAMWFDQTMNEIYDGAIEPAIRHAGYDPLRIDRAEHVNRIDDEIIGQIRRSRFMVADFTGQRHGVYFEAGMMQGIGRTVIWMCRKNEIRDSLHFDVRQFNFIDYESVEEAKDRLYRRILALEGEGAGATGQA